MKRERFPLTSEQMELLLAFEVSGSLERLAELMAKDPSVISRNLRRLADEWPVLIKSAGRWQITPLGRQVNSMSREYQSRLNALTGVLKKRKWGSSPFAFSQQSLLVVINAQKALQDPAYGRRNNSEAERNILKLLNYFRSEKRSIAHVKHVSDNPASFFYTASSGTDFIPALAPKEYEAVFEKAKASVFSAIGFEKYARSLKVDSLILTGFTAGECIDATARQGHDLGFKIIIIADATATFDIKGPKGKLHKAEKIHKGTLAVLHSLFAEVVETDVILDG
jgi:nicotinamidase-related amidase